MDGHADQPADQRPVDADELQVAADRALEPVGQRLRVPAAHGFRHQLADLRAVAGREADHGPAGEALALTLAKEELANGVRVNIVAPALTVSDMGEKLSRAITGNADIHHLDTKMPFGRVAVPAEGAAGFAAVVAELTAGASVPEPSGATWVDA